MRRLAFARVVVPLVVLLIAGCGSTEPTPPPTSPPSSASTATPAAPSVSAPSATRPTASPADPFVGALAVTVSNRVRVRSAPEVSDTSRKYEPLLPLGTELRVIGGPVAASGYVWYDVMPVGTTLVVEATATVVDHGWVAVADHDGTPWLALADAPVAGLEVERSEVARAPAVRTAALSTASAVTAFGLDLYREVLADPTLGLRDRNLVFSPTSIALALGMARAGARGETGSQIDGLLGASAVEPLLAGLNALDQALASRDGTYVDDEGNAHSLALRIANASFAQHGWSVQPSYLDTIASRFGAGLNFVDYVTDPELARRTINAWVSQKTAGRIPELLQPPNVSTATRLYLVNAIYLKANWLVEFRKDQTAASSFVRLDRSKIAVPTMHLEGGQDVPYLRGDGWQATELRYRGPSNTAPLAMTLIMPDDLASFESNLSAKQLSRIAADLGAEQRRLRDSIDYGDSPGASCGTYPYSLKLAMPRFKLGTRAQLKDVLANLGMPLAFDPDRADFSGIHIPESDVDGIYVSDVIHQADIDVDELGTEAAAATAIGMDTGGCTGPSPARSLSLRLDHPFLFALRDLDTGAVLFLGRVVDPSDAG